MSLSIKSVIIRASLFAAALASSVTAPAFAADASITVIKSPERGNTALVGFDDLNLTSPAGQRALQTRLRGAVKAVCSSSKITILERHTDERRCTKASWAGIQPQLEAVLR